MPKLPQASQQAANEAETRDFEAFPPGIYVAQLSAVEERVAQGSGNPYWSWEFTITDDAPPESKARGRKVWVNSSLDEKSAWKLKEIFDALNYTTDSDTEEMIGERCRLQITQETQQQGQRAGQLVNQAKKCMPMEGATASSGASGAGSGAGGKTASAQQADDPWS